MTRQHHSIFRILLPGSLLIAFALAACKKESPVQVAPPPPPLVQSPRNYTWTLDTLKYPGSYQTSMYDIWGSASNDLYVVGHNEGNSGQMYRYNGTSWQAVKLAISEGGQLRGAFDLTRIYGFAPNDIFAVGASLYSSILPPNEILDSSLIIHYDGTSWREMPLAERGGNLQAIWGSSPADLWSGGVGGTLYHYDGAQWRKVPFPEECWFASIAGFGPSDVYALTYTFDSAPRDTTIYSLWHFDGSIWSLQYTYNEVYPQPATLGSHRLRVLFGSLYSLGDGLFVQAGSSWTRIFHDPPVALFDLNGIAPDNLFLIGIPDRVYHYNGTDYYRYAELSHLPFAPYGIWADSSEVFIAGNDGYTTYILHGK